ncbi:MAG: hypothetical protein U0L09_09215, partial [Christensenellales bacterium]|nr:hypothetical protein [Christensenellales bacterium]
VRLPAALAQLIKKEHPKMLYIPRVPSISVFSPAALAGRRPATACCRPLTIKDRGRDIHISTRNPFMNLWVKASANAHPRILFLKPVPDLSSL